MFSGGSQTAHLETLSAKKARGFLDVKGWFAPCMLGEGQL